MLGYKGIKRIVMLWGLASEWFILILIFRLLAILEA